MANTLYVVATPIGNLDDVSVRAVKVLLGAPVIACEDTRHTGQLIRILEDRFPEYVVEKNRRYLSVRDWNEAEIVGKVVEELKTSDVALVSDAGTPLLSDPGFKVVRAARESGFSVVPIPGPFAGAAALVASGLPTNKFMFWGFLPKKWSLESAVSHIIYESPIRSEKTIIAIRERYPTAKIMVAQELTKVHERIEEGKDGMKFKGEVTLVVYIPD